MATFRNAQTVQTSDGWTSMVLTKPTGLTVGDVMLAAILQTSNSANTWASISPPASWTSVQDVNAGAGRYNRLLVFSKVANSADVAASNFTFTAGLSPTSYNSVGVIAAWSIANAGSAINVSTQVFNSVGANSIPSAATTTTVATARLAVFFSGGAGTGIIPTMTPPAGMTERAEVSATGGPYGNLMLADEQLSATGTYTRTATYDSAGSGSSLVIAVGLNDTGGSVLITNVDGDNIIRSDQTDVVVTGSGFGASQGSGSVTLRQGTTSLTQTIDSWSATSIQFDTVILQTGADIKHGTTTLRVTDTSANIGEQTITVNPPTGQLYVDLTSVASPSSGRITAFPDLAVGDQLWIRGSGGGAAPTGLVVNADATFYFTAGNSPADFEVRVWDSSDSTWGDWSSFSFLSGNVGTANVGTVTVNPATVVVLTGMQAVTYLAEVYPGLDTVVTGNGMLASVGNVNIGTNAVVNVEGVSATGEVTRLTIWSTIIGAQPGSNWVVIVT